MALIMQMTPGADNLSVWVFRMKSEGTNQVANGSFASGSSWTVNADWIITGGAATYDFISVAGADLDQTLSSSVDAVSYILEYEIVKAVGTFTLTLIGTGASIVAANVVLPVTLGVHRITIFGVSGKSLLRFHTGGFGGVESMHLDNVKLRKAEETTYFATKTLTLDNTYDGEVLSFSERLSNIDESMDILSSGSISGVSTYTFTVARHISNTKFNSWFDEFYPSTDGGGLISKDCEIGLVWSTASNDTEITWLMRGRIIDYRFEPRKMTFTILQSTEIDSRPIPYYTVQKDFDNEVSFFTNAPDENYGLTIPIVYGNRSDWRPIIWTFRLSPCVLVDKEKMTFIVSSHKVDAASTGVVLGSITLTGSNVFKYISGLDTYMACYKTSGNGSANSNTDIRHTISMFDSISAGNNLLGWIITRLTTPSSYSDVAQEKMLNFITTDFTDLDSSEVVAAKLAGSVSTSETGYLSLTAADVAIEFSVKSNEASPAGDRLYEVGFNNLTLSSPPNLSVTNATFTNGVSTSIIKHEFGADSTNKKESSFPWTMEEVTNLDYFVENDDVNVGDLLKVQYGNIRLFNIEVVAFLKKLPLIGASRTELIGAAFHGVEFVRRIVERYSGRKPPEPERLDRSTVDNAFAHVDGREYGRWIDFATSAGGTRNDNNGSANDPGFAENALIETPAYIIESIFRDEVLVERDMQLTQVSNTTFTAVDLISREDDYYNNAEFFNATTIKKRYVTDYVGSTNTITISANDGAMANDDNFYLTNIQGDNRIDINSFDVVGNETDGKRSANDGWKFANTLLFKSPINEIVNTLCFDSHSQVFETADEDAGHSKIKIVALDAATSGDTWSKPAFLRGVEGVRTSLTSLGNIFTSFRLSYVFEVGNSDYRKEIFVDKNGFSSPASTLKVADQLLCKKAEQVYNLTKPFVYSSNWIYDDTCAELFLQKKIEWFTKQRLIVDWTSPLTDRGTGGTTDYIKYERGDQIKLNYSQSIPIGLNNSSFFMITNKRMITRQGAPLIEWRLIEMG